MSLFSKELITNEDYLVIIGVTPVVTIGPRAGGNRRGLISESLWHLSRLSLLKIPKICLDI
jgi:hypothetical protein